MRTFKSFINESFQTGVPVTITYIRNRNKSPNFGDLYGQHIEPAGRYMTLKPESFKQENFPNIEVGKITFQNPLTIPFGGGYQDKTNWKFVLSSMFGNRKGKSLSRSIARKGYDGIITIEKNGIPGEIVDISMFKQNGSIQ